MFLLYDIEQVVCCNLEDTYKKITIVVEKYWRLLCEAYEDTSSFDFIDVNNRLSDVQNRSQQVYQKASKRYVTVM